MEHIYAILDIIVKYLPIILCFIGFYKFHEQYKFNSKLEEQKTNLAKNLEHYKQELASLTETVKYQHQKQLTDFSLFATKKHEKCIVLYERLCEAIAKIHHRKNIEVNLPSNEEIQKENIEVINAFNEAQKAFREAGLYLDENLSTEIEDYFDKLKFIVSFYSNGQNVDKKDLALLVAEFDIIIIKLRENLLN
ncbi:hypothetical protein [Pectinatus sottacetonis]|uniref:hypothetical protein n=1 Tax=Pectinatus sottacetonis TaxID=1002795 RepID=UPI0018C4A3CC|nr:hypothetical protein [Pectinatus sottacetonis]